MSSYAPIGFSEPVHVYTSNMHFREQHIVHSAFQVSGVQTPYVTYLQSVWLASCLDR